MANFPRFILKQRASIKANNERKLRNQSEKKKKKVASKDKNDVGERDKNSQLETGMDLKAKNWAKNLLKERLELDVLENQDLEVEN